MKTTFNSKFLLPIISCLFLHPINAYSENKTIEIKGVIKYGSLDSGIESKEGNSIGFLTNSEIGKKIFNICGSAEECKVTAVVDENEFIKSVIKINDITQIDQLKNPSFDCNKSTTFVEKTICSDNRLSELDLQMMNIYKKLLKTQSISNLKDDQKIWIKNSRNICTDKLCIEKSYNERISKLNSLENSKKNLNNNAEECLDSWVKAYRNEAGEDAIVSQDHIDEWENWCNQGKTPDLNNSEKELSSNQSIDDSNHIKIKGFYVGMDFNESCNNISKVYQIDRNKVRKDKNECFYPDMYSGIKVTSSKNNTADKITISKSIFQTNSSDKQFLQDLANAYNLKLEFYKEIELFGPKKGALFMHAGEYEFIEVSVPMGTITMTNRIKGKFD